MTKVKTALVIIGFLIIMGIVGRMDKQDAERIPTSDIVRIEEDSPLWNCATMGNYYCGKG